MIVLYRQEKSPEADAIEAEFRELVLGYDRVIMNPAQARELFGEHSLPVIKNNERVVSGDDIQPYLKELTNLMRDWQMFQGDYCYVDEDGESG
jgi:hypothetical protein